MVIFTSGWWGLLVAGVILGAWIIIYQLFGRPRGVPAELLILRVFGQGALARSIAKVWRYDQGAVTLLAGPEWMDHSPGIATVFAAANAADPVAAIGDRGKAIRNAMDLQRMLSQQKSIFSWRIS